MGLVKSTSSRGEAPSSAVLLALVCPTHRSSLALCRPAERWTASATAPSHSPTTSRRTAPGRGGVPKTRDNQERRARPPIIAHLGQLPLQDITAADLRTFISKLESTVSSTDHLRGILSELSSLLAAAVEDKRLASNPMHAKSVR
ncbi:hypothetical protein ACFYO9_11525 [Streptomyces sp. NPDC005863]|uniref:hypothetical protein n=1 Tax=unclassified Streptomyces TaxID=2593676 RepID=UPI0033CDE11B